MSKVYVEIDPKTLLPIRIFRHTKRALASDPEYVQQMERKLAVSYIRQQVVFRARSGKLLLCDFCGNVVTEQIGEMHEVLPRGKGGEVSLDNCKFICNGCHTGANDSEHGDRKFQSSKIKENDASND
jgi:5-methylcytosine-specific restriction endonuclease McrA